MFLFLILLLVAITNSSSNTFIWGKLGQDIDGEALGDFSGHSVSFSSDGQTVAIGAYKNVNRGETKGHVRVYRFINNEWIQYGQDIDGEAAGDQSGYSVSLSSDGETVAIGAPKNSINDALAGHVRVYRYSSELGGWIFYDNLPWSLNGKDWNDHAGWSVSLSSDGKTVAIGAPQITVGSGCVRVYRSVNDIWTQLGRDIDGEATGDYYGHSVSLSSNGETVAIGAPYAAKDDEYSGHVRVYRFVNNQWSQLGQDIDGENYYDQSGWSVTLSSDGETVAIGAPENEGNGYFAGHVRVYRFGGTSWSQLGKDIDGETKYDRFGWSTSLSSDGNTVAIGAPYNDGQGDERGYVRVYSFIDNQWTQLGQDIDGETDGDSSGWSVSLSSNGARVAIGAIGNGEFKGHVRVYQLLSFPQTIDENHIQTIGIVVIAVITPVVFSMIVYYFARK